MKNYYLAIDIGASSGRHILACTENGRLTLSEIYRFENGFKERGGSLVWDIAHLEGEVKNGLRVCAEMGITPKSVAIDTWGVDYVLLDENKKVLSPVYCYRDARTAEAVKEVENIIPFETLYAKTGIQKQIFNTVYQLYCDKKSGKLDKAKHFMMMPDYLAYTLTGVIKNEYTNATTSGMVNAETKQGKARPWLLLSAPLVTVTGILLFVVPESNQTVQAIWVMISYNLFYSFAYTIFNMSHGLMVPLSTRNTEQRGSLSVFNQIATIMMSGIIVALIFPMVVMPMLGVDKSKWITVMVILSILALPLTLLEYYFTKERVTLENAEVEEEKVPYKQVLKAIFTDKYMLLIFAYFLIYTIGMCFKNLGLVYYCNYVLGTYNDGKTQTLVSILGGIPMGIGIFAVWPLAKKFGKRNLTMAGFVLYALGSGICWLFPTNMVIVLVGQFIKNIGGLPCAYVFMALFADVLDHMEWKHKFRVDGSAMSVYNIIAVSSVGVVTGLFNMMLSKTGYVAPFYNEAGELIAVQTEAVKNAITFSFVGLETITGIILVVLLLFLNVEKTIGKKQEEIKARKGTDEPAEQG